MTEFASRIKNCSAIEHDILAEKLLQKRIINERQKKKVTDEKTGHSSGQRMDELLDIVKDSIKVDETTFHDFLEILLGENTRITDKLHSDMLNKYKQY